MQSSYLDLVPHIYSAGFPRILESHGKSRNLRKEFSGPGKSWKMNVVMESHEIPLIGHMEFFHRRIIILGV